MDLPPLMPMIDVKNCVTASSQPDTRRNDTSVSATTTKRTSMEPMAIYERSWITHTMSIIEKVRGLLEIWFIVSSWTHQRQFVHDGIIDDYLESANEDVPENARDSGIPWLILTVGAKGAGKQHVLRELVESGHLPVTSAGLVRVDQDDIRRCLPEYDWYLSHAPDLVADMTRQEAGYIAETLCLASLRGGKTVVWDCALGNVDWYASRIKELIHMIPRLKVSMMYINASLDQIQERCRKGAEITGRTLSPSAISEAVARVPENVERIKQKVNFDFFCTIKNDDAVLDIDGDQDFGVFSSVPTPSSSHIGCQSTRLSLVTFDAAPVSESRRKSYRVSRADGAIMEGAPDHRLRRKSFRRSTRRVASYTKSTEENHMSPDMNFYGPFAHIRKTLDYEYHCNYTYERQRFQDTIILEFLQAAIIKDKDGELCTTPTEPWLCFTAGPMGAGKSYTMRNLVDEGRFPLLAFVKVDPDEIRRQLPEYHLYVTDSPSLAGELTNKEAGFIGEILTLAGLENGKVRRATPLRFFSFLDDYLTLYSLAPSSLQNVLVDGSLRDSDWYQLYFKRIRKEFPVVRIAILQVSAPREAVFQRAAARAKSTGRVVPKMVLERALEQVPRSVKILAPLVDYHIELMNAPEADDIEIVTDGETWESFKSHWDLRLYSPKAKEKELFVKQLTVFLGGILLLPDLRAWDNALCQRSEYIVAFRNDGANVLTMILDI
eukprot:scaffold2536_cov169-Amphora_coffeaeformis.AAC.12